MSDLKTDRVRQLEKAVREAQMFLNSMPTIPSVDSYINEGVVGARNALNEVLPIAPAQHQFRTIGVE